MQALSDRELVTLALADNPLAFQTLERFERLDPPLADTDTASTVPDLDRLLAVLTSEQRACMLLCFSHGYSHTEASALLGLPLGTLKSTLRRSLEQIREHWKQRSLRLLACLPAAAGMGGLAMALLPSLDAVIAAGSSVFPQLAPYVFQALRDGGLLLPAALLAVTLLGPVVADHLQEP